MNTTTLILLVVVSIAFVIWLVATIENRRKIQRARLRGLWPEDGRTPTVEDVKRLAQAGEKLLAIKLYRKIQHVGLKPAKEFVERLAC